MKWLILLLSSVVFISSCNQVPGDSQAKVKAATFKIAYNVLVNDTSYDYDIFVMNTDGTGKTNLTGHPDVAWTYLTGKNKVYFISDRDTAYRNYFLYEMTPAGNNVRRISDLRLEDSWMDTRFNEKEMVVSGRIGKEIRFQLFIVDIGTGSYRQITNDTTAFYRDPLFSPDGQQIVCAYQADKRNNNRHEELFIMNADGSGMKQLTFFPESDSAIKEHSYKAGPPRWHPTENFISYISKQSGKYSIYTVTPDGQKHSKLTDNPISEGWHDWSPDGEWLAFDSGNEDGSAYHIMLMNWKTKVITQLTDTTFKYHQAPVFVEMD